MISSSSSRLILAAAAFCFFLSPPLARAETAAVSPPLMSSHEAIQWEGQPSALIDNPTPDQQSTQTAIPSAVFPRAQIYPPASQTQTSPLPPVFPGTPLSTTVSGVDTNLHAPLFPLPAKPAAPTSANIIATTSPVTPLPPEPVKIINTVTDGSSTSPEPKITPAVIAIIPASSPSIQTVDISDDKNMSPTTNSANVKEPSVISQAPPPPPITKPQHLIVAEVSKPFVPEQLQTSSVPTIPNAIPAAPLSSQDERAYETPQGLASIPEKTTEIETSAASSIRESKPLIVTQASKLIPSDAPHNEVAEATQASPAVSNLNQQVSTSSLSVPSKDLTSISTQTSTTAPATTQVITPRAKAIEPATLSDYLPAPVEETKKETAISREEENVWSMQLEALERENQAMREKLHVGESDSLSDIKVDAVAQIHENVLRERIAELEKEIDKLNAHTHDDLPQKSSSKTSITLKPNKTPDLNSTSP